MMCLSALQCRDIVSLQMKIQEIVDVTPNPSYHLSLCRDRIMFLKCRAMPPLSELAKPNKILARIQIDSLLNFAIQMFMVKS